MLWGGPRGPEVPPGTYQARLTVAGAEQVRAANGHQTSIADDSHRLAQAFGFGQGVGLVPGDVQGAFEVPGGEFLR